MRNLVLISLLAGAAIAMPAQAQERDGHRGHRSDQSDSSASSDSDRGSRRSERATERRSDDNSSSQSQQQQQPARERPVMRERPTDSGSQQQFGGGFGGRHRDQDSDTAPSNSGAGDTVRNWRGPGRGAADTGNAATDEDSVRNWRGRDRRPDSPTQVQDRNLGTGTTETDNRSIEERNMRRVRDGTFDRSVQTTPGFGGRVRRIGTNVPAEGTAPPPVTTEMARRGTTAHRWNHDWRSDNRYDWRRWRDRNRSRFHLSFYFDPFGWSYRRYNIGWQLWPSYYGQDFWLNDPWQYRLPPAYGPYRWIRYYDDALLVNIYTGTVADVIYNFFW